MKALNEKALLVSLFISNWSARKYDNKATATVNREHKATDSGRFNKVLIAKENLKELTQIVGRAREFHYTNTLPWGDSGERLLPVASFIDYGTGLSAIKSEFETAVRSFALHYPTMIEEAKQHLGDLFNERDYPRDILSKFDMKTSFVPIPDTEDIRVNLSPSEVETLRKDLEVNIKDSFANAQRDIYTRVVDRLTYMFDRLADKDSTFRDSLFENVKELVDIIPKLNIADDPQITDMCNDLNSLYTDPESVRKDKKLRAEKALQVKDMLNKISAFA